VLVPVGSSERVWAVFRAKPRKEMFLVDFLSSEGFRVYCPMLGEKGSRLRPKPCFPGYFFAEISPRFELTAVSKTPNVMCPLLFGGQLAALEPEHIDSFRAMESSEGIIEVARPEKFRKGQVVRILNGSFAGLDAVVTEWLPEKERVRLLLDYFGREVALEADEALLA